MAFGIDDIATGTAVANGLYNLGNNIFGFGNGMSHHDERVAKRLYDYQQNANLQYQKKALEEYTKPYYEWQKKNSAKLDVEGMQAAGINPLMAFGGSGAPAVGDSLQASSPSETLSGLLSASATQEQTEISKRMANAEIMKTTADTAKTISETRSQNTFNKFAHDLYEGQAKTAQGNSILVDTQIKLNKVSTRKLYKEMANIDSLTEQYNAMTDNLRETLNLLKQQGKINDKMLDKIAEETALTHVQMLREQYGLEHIDPATVQQIKAATKYQLMSADALLPTIMWAQFLQSNPNDASDYFKGMVNAQKGQGFINVTQGEQGKISLDIRSGKFGKLFENTWNKATQGFEGPEKYVLGAAACGQMFLQVLIQNVGSVLGQVAGFVK